jgi:DNA-binding response OmpR family regulator
VAVIESDRAAGEMLHLFFHLMELECSLLPCGPDAVSTLSRSRPDVLLLDLDLPDGRAHAIAGEIQATLPTLRIIYLSDFEPPEDVGPVVAKPHGAFEEMLRVFEVVLERGSR